MVWDRRDSIRAVQGDDDRHFWRYRHDRGCSGAYSWGPSCNCGLYEAVSELYKKAGLT